MGAICVTRLTWAGAVTGLLLATPLPASSAWIYGGISVTGGLGSASLSTPGTDRIVLDAVSIEHSSIRRVPGDVR